MLQEKERKQILRYCIYPKIALTAIILSLVLAVLILPLEMIDDLVFHNKGFQPAGLYTILGFVAVYVIIFCYCTLCPRFGMRGKRWAALQAGLNVPQTEKDHSGQIASTLALQSSGRLLSKSDNDTAKHIGGALEVAGAVSAVATAADVLSETWGNAESMAHAYGVPIPNIKKQLIAFAVLPVLIVIGIYIPQYVQGNQAIQEKIAASAEQLQIAEDALSPVCEYVSADDPYENYHDYGYHVSGYLRERGSGTQTCYVYLTFDESGIITEVSYCCEIDINISLEENLRQIEQDFETLEAPLANLNISVANPELLTLHRLPEEFKEAFLTGTIYENIHIYTNAAPIRLSCSFVTDSEEDFDEYSRPYIMFWISTAE